MYVVDLRRLHRIQLGKFQVGWAPLIVVSGDARIAGS